MAFLNADTSCGQHLFPPAGLIATSRPAPPLPPTHSSAPSVVFVTMHKAGSVIANTLLARLLMDEGMARVDIAGEAFRAGLKEWLYCVERSHLLATPGYYFGAFRGTYVRKFKDLSRNRLIVQLRDPRDCIVSLYYSYRISHGPPGDGPTRRVFDKVREHLRDMSIDEFALRNIKHYRKRVAVLEAVMAQYPNHVLVKYEDMVGNFEHWLQRICTFLPVAPPEQTLVELRRLADFRVSGEDEHRHRRQVTPGDFRRKLQPATQAALTNGLGRQLALFGYDLHNAP